MQGQRQIRANPQQRGKYNASKKRKKNGAQTVPVECAAMISSLPRGADVISQTKQTQN